MHGLFFPGQYGFRSGHSTELASVEFVDRILSFMDKNLTPFSVYIDLSKALTSLIIRYCWKNWPSMDWILLPLLQFRIIFLIENNL